MEYIYDFNNLEKDNEIYFERFEEVTEDLFNILENYQKCISDTKSTIMIQDNIKTTIKESNIFKSILNTNESIVKFKKKELDDLVKLINRLYISKLLDNEFTNIIIKLIDNSEDFIYYHEKFGIIELINTCLMEELSLYQIEFIDNEQLMIKLSNKTTYLLNRPKTSKKPQSNGTRHLDTVLSYPETFFIKEVMKCTYALLSQQLSILIMNIIKIDSEELPSHLVDIILLRSHFNRIIEYINKIKNLTGINENNYNANHAINTFKTLINNLLIDKYYLMSLSPKEKRTLYIESMVPVDIKYKKISLSNDKDKI